MWIRECRDGGGSKVCGRLWGDGGDRRCRGGGEKMREWGDRRGRSGVGGLGVEWVLSQGDEGNG